MFSPCDSADSLVSCNEIAYRWVKGSRRTVEFKTSRLSLVQNRYFTAIGSSSVERLLIITSTGNDNFSVRVMFTWFPWNAKHSAQAAFAYFWRNWLRRWHGNSTQRTQRRKGKKREQEINHSSQVPPPRQSYSPCGVTIFGFAAVPVFPLWRNGKISKWSRIQYSCRITPKMESLVVYAMPDIPSIFQKDRPQLFELSC